MLGSNSLHEITDAKPADAYIETLTKRIEGLVYWVNKTKPLPEDVDDSDTGKAFMIRYMHHAYKIRLEESRRNLKLAKNMLL